MDLDAFERVHARRLGAARRARPARRRTGAEADELVRLYQSVATDLSSVRSAAPDPEMVTRLSMLVGRARAAIAGTHEPRWRDVTRVRRRVAARGPLPDPVVDGRRDGGVPRARRRRGRLGGDPARRARVDGHAEPAAGVRRELVRGVLHARRGLRAMVWTNNAWIAARASPPGSPASWPVYVPGQNAMIVGATGGMMAAHGHLDVFLQLIAPHGLLELTAVFVAGRRRPADLLDLDRPGPAHPRPGAGAGGARPVHRGDRARGRRSRSPA